MYENPGGGHSPLPPLQTPMVPKTLRHVNLALTGLYNNLKTKRQV